MPSTSVDETVTRLLSELTVEEKLAMLDGDTELWPGLLDTARHDAYHRHPWPAGVVDRLGVGGLHFVDGPRGVVLEGAATTYPAAIARGAAFDTDLEQRIGDALGREARAVGANLFGGVCLNLLRHPGWGRAQETYSEDPVHLAAMGAAVVRGASPHAIACVKHFALNSIDSARFRVDVQASPRVLHEVYLPHFRAAVDAGAMSVMSAYNSVNGAWCGQNETLLTDVLKTRWGFSGFVVTDFIFGVHDGADAVRAGLDLEMPFRFILAADLPAAVEDGDVPMSRVDDAVARMLRAQLSLPDDPDSSRYPADVLGCSEHVALAREAAVKSIVLLANAPAASPGDASPDAVPHDAGPHDAGPHDAGTNGEAPLLPLPDSGRLAVIGYLADEPNLGDRGSSDTRPRHVVTPLAGLKEAAPGLDISYATGADQNHAAAVAAEADAAVVVVGLSWRNEGENINLDDVEWAVRRFPPPPLLGRLPHRLADTMWSPVARMLGALARRSASGLVAGTTSGFTSGDRTNLRLDPTDEALVRRVAAANPRTVVVLMGGGAVVTESWRHHVPAIVLLWYPGQEGGHALADVLLGRVSPSGRMPFTVPTRHDHLPLLDPRATSVTYDLWHGYRLLARDGHEAAFPFGHGLSYTTFEHRTLTATAADEGVTVAVDVSNTGAMAAEHVVHVYVEPPGMQVERPVRQLAGFTRVFVPESDTVTAEVSIPWDVMGYVDESGEKRVVEPGTHRFVTAPHALADAETSTTVDLERRVLPA